MTPPAEIVTIKRPPARWPAFMLWMRRIHMYTGLLLLPWVLLYGATAVMFNHPSLISHAEFRDFEAADDTTGGLAKLPEPEQLARAVIARLNEKGAGLELSDTIPADYTGVVFYDVQAEGAMHNVRYDVSSGRGFVRTVEREGPEADRQAVFAAESGVKMDEFQPRNIDESARSVLASMEIEAQKLTPRAMPRLRFPARDKQGEEWIVTWDAQRGSVAARLAAAPRELPVRDYLTLMHRMHGYPERDGVRTVWAIIADTMGVLMLFWGLSGVLMWWQLKRTRLWGALAILASIGAGAAMFTMMFLEIRGLA